MCARSDKPVQISGEVRTLIVESPSFQSDADLEMLKSRTWKRAIDRTMEEEKGSLTGPKRGEMPRWRIELGSTPMLKAGDKKGAHNFLRCIERVIAIGGWTKYEANYLRVLRRKWMKRAQGTDAHFNKEGNKWYSEKTSSKTKQSKRKGKDSDQK